MYQMTTLMNKQIKCKQILLEFDYYTKYPIRDVIKTIETCGFHSHCHKTVLQLCF